MRALLDLLLEAGVGFLQPSGHVVELVGQQFELVAGLDRDALLEIAAADLRRALAQLLDRNDHLAGEEQAGEEGQHQAAHQQIARPLDRFVERRIGLVDRQLDEHQPAQRQDRRMRGQHLAALHVVDDLDAFLRDAPSVLRAALT